MNMQIFLKPPGKFYHIPPQAPFIDIPIDKKAHNIINSLVLLVCPWLPFPSLLIDFLNKYTYLSVKNN